jgi:hypothetical protein
LLFAAPENTYSSYKRIFYFLQALRLLRDVVASEVATLPAVQAAGCIGAVVGVLGAAGSRKQQGGGSSDAARAAPGLARLAQQVWFAWWQGVAFGSSVGVLQCVLPGKMYCWTALGPPALSTLHSDAALMGAY